MTNVSHNFSNYMHNLIKISFFILIILGLLNSSCSKNKIDYSKLKENYSAETISYFSEVGFYQNKTLRKWEKNLTVSISGTVDESDIKSVDEFVDIFNKLSSSVKIKTTEEDGDIKINITDNPILNKQGCHGLTWKYGKYNSSFSNEITHAKILVSTFLDTKKRRKTIHHELLHAIGLSDTKKEFEKQNTLGITSYKSIDDYEERIPEMYDIPELDKMAMMILYDYGLPVGLKRETFISKLGMN